MESLLSLLRMHWDHELTPNPSQEGNGQDADGCLFPSWEGSGVGRFMERAGTASGALFLPPRIFQKVFDILNPMPFHSPAKNMKTTLTINIGTCSVCAQGRMSIWHRGARPPGNVGGRF